MRRNVFYHLSGKHKEQELVALLQQGCDPTACLVDHNWEMTLLLWAIHVNYFELAALLLNKEFFKHTEYHYFSFSYFNDNNMLDYRGGKVEDEGLSFTALQLAAKKGRHELVQGLLNNHKNYLGGKFTYCFEDRNRALELAVKYNHANCVETLLRDNPYPDPLFYGLLFVYAARHGYKEIMRVFIEFNININSVDMKGTTALMAAASAGRYDIAVYLLQEGASPLLLNRAGKSFATKSRDPAIRDYFQMIIDVYQYMLQTNDQFYLSKSTSNRKLKAAGMLYEALLQKEGCSLCHLKKAIDQAACDTLLIKFAQAFSKKYIVPQSSIDETQACEVKRQHVLLQHQSKNNKWKKETYHASGVLTLFCNQDYKQMESEEGLEMVVYKRKTG